VSLVGLRIGSSGLAAAQRALETAANNIANSNTVGYSRQRVEFSTADPIGTSRGGLGPGATSLGVTVEAVSRASDTLVTANFRETSAQLASWDARAAFFGRAEQVLGPLDEGTSQALAAFWNSWELLSQTPDSATSRDQVLDAGRNLAGSLNDASKRLTDLRRDVETEMRGVVVQVNDLAAEVAGLNVQIKQSVTRGDAPNDLMDKRDLALAALSRLTGAQTSFQADGDAQATVNNLPLVDGVRSDSLAVTGNPPTVVWQRDGSTVAASGQLGSLAELATTGTDDLLGRLDEIALELAEVVNVAHRVGFGLDGIDGRDFFSASGAADIALDAGLTKDTVAASSSGAAADGNHALEMGGLRSTVGATGQTVSELLNTLQGFLGREAGQASNQRDLAAIVVNDATRALAEASGVSTDEELTNMLRFQRAYEASARVITIIDEMLDRLINGTGATR